MRFWWTIVFLSIWIVIFPLAGILAAYETGYFEISFISYISIISIFNLIWFIISSKRNNKIGFLNTFFNLLILNVPSYFLIKKYFKLKNDQNTIKQIKENPSNNEEYNFDLSTREREDLRKKNDEKYKKLLKEAELKNRLNNEILGERKISKAFVTYLIYLIYKDKPNIVNTYSIIQEFKDYTNNLTNNNLINIFNSLKNKNIFFDDNIIESEKQIIDVLNKLSTEEYNVIFKQDRVDIMILAKKIADKEK